MALNKYCIFCVVVSTTCQLHCFGSKQFFIYLQLVTAPAYPPEEIVNTLGAGDTFIAACIKALSNDVDLASSINFACKVAGAKCGLKNLDELRDMAFEF